jgi:hypothetical protein
MRKICGAASDASLRTFFGGGGNNALRCLGVREAALEGVSTGAVDVGATVTVGPCIGAGGTEAGGAAGAAGDDALLGWAAGLQAANASDATEIQNTARTLRSIPAWFCPCCVENSQGARYF